MIYIVRKNSGDNGKVLDIVKVDGEIIPGCSVQTYNPVDNETQLWYIIHNLDDTYTVQSKYNQEVVLAIGNELSAETGMEESLIIGDNVIVTTYDSENTPGCRWTFSLEEEPLLADPYDCLWSYMFRNPYMARHISQKYSVSHYGVDMTVAGGEILGYPVYSVSTGTVLYENYSSSAGYYAAIKMNDGYTVRYLHLQARSLVSENQTVTSASQIGYVGDTGNSTGPHLHFDVNTVGAISGGTGSSNVNYGTTVDPLDFYSDYAFTY